MVAGAGIAAGGAAAGAGRGVAASARRADGVPGRCGDHDGGAGGVLRSDAVAHRAVAARCAGDGAAPVVAAAPLRARPRPPAPAARRPVEGADQPRPAGAARRGARAHRAARRFPVALRRPRTAADARARAHAPPSRRPPGELRRGRAALRVLVQPAGAPGGPILSPRSGTRLRPGGDRGPSRFATRVRRSDAQDPHGRPAGAAGLPLGVLPSPEGASHATHIPDAASVDAAHRRHHRRAARAGHRFRGLVRAAGARTEGRDPGHRPARRRPPPRCHPAHRRRQGRTFLDGSIPKAGC